MHELVFAERFIADMTQVSSARVRNRILNEVDLLRENPELGSALVPQGVIDRFGPQVRRLSVPPFLVVYLIAGEEIHVLGIMHARRAY